MEKFKEKKIVQILSSISIAAGIVFFVSFIGVFLSLRWVYLIFPNLFIFIILHILSSSLSKKDKYTREFITYIEKRIGEAVTVSDYLELLNEFKHLAIENGVYCLSFPMKIKKLHQEIITSIQTLSKVKS